MKKILIVLAIVLSLFCVWNIFKSDNDVACDGQKYSKEYVSYNTESGIYHDLDCDCAKRCTINCVVIKRSEAINRGGRACKWCHGGNSHLFDDIDKEVEQEN